MQQVNSVLLIDDDSIFNMISKKIIQIAKFAPKVDSYLDASAALNELRELIKNDPDEFPEVIFLDINMPEMDGWAFLDEFKKFPEFILKKCKVFMLTSSIDDHDIAKSKTYQIVYDFISKPLSFSKLETLHSNPYQYI